MLILASLLGVAFCVGAAPTTAQAMPDIDSLWDYKDNAGSAARFRDAPPAAERAGNDAYLGIDRDREARTYFRRAYEGQSKDECAQKHEAERLARINALGDH